MNRLYTFRNQIGKRLTDWIPEKKLFFFSMIYLFSILYVPNNKILLLFSVVFVTVLSNFFSSFSAALLYAVIFLLPFQGGKGIDFLVVDQAYVYGHIPFIINVSLSLSGFSTILLIYISIRRYLYQNSHVSPTDYIRSSDYALGIYYVSSLFGTLLSPIPLLSFLLFLQQSIYIFIYFYIRGNSLGKWIISYMPIALSALSIFEGVICMLQYVNKGPLGKLIEDSFDPALGKNILHVAAEDISFIRIQGTFSHPNSLGFFMALIAPILFYYSARKVSNLFIRGITTLGFLSAISALILSASRLSWIVTGIELFLIAWLLKREISLPKIYSWGFLIIILLFPILIIPRISQLAVTFGPDGGANYRWNLILYSIKIAAENPFGIGLGTFPKILLEEIGGFTSFPTQPHNIFAQILVSSGYLGLLACMYFLYFLRTTFATRVYKLRHIVELDTSVYIVPIVSFFILAQFYPILTEQQIIGWIWIFLSVIV